MLAGKRHERLKRRVRVSDVEWPRLIKRCHDTPANGWRNCFRDINVTHTQLGLTRGKMADPRLEHINPVWSDFMMYFSTGAQKLCHTNFSK